MPASPATFEVSSLVINPVQARPGEQVNVQVKVSNTGGTAGQYDVILSVNNTKVDSKTITLGEGASATVQLTTTAGNTPATYSVDVNGMSGSFTVVAAQQTPAPTTQPVITPATPAASPAPAANPPSGQP